MALDDADKKFIADLVKNNSEELGKKFVTAEAATKMVEQGVKSAIDGLKLDEKIKAAVGEKQPTAGDDKKGKDGGKTDDPTSAKVTALENQLREQAEENKRSKDAARAQKLETNLVHALTAAGIPAERHKHVLPFLRGLKTTDGKPVVSIDENDKITWRAQKNGYVDDLELAAGVKEWVGTDDGKVYLPPVGTQGTGDGNGGRTGPRDTSAPRKADGTLDVGALRDKLLPAIGNAIAQQ